MHCPKWLLEWDAEPGEHTRTVKAIDGEANPQTSEQQGVTRDGATGLHNVTVAIECDTDCDGSA